MTAQGDMHTHVLYTSSVLRTRFNAMDRPAPTPVSTAKFLACTHGPPCWNACICFTISANHHRQLSCIAQELTQPDSMQNMAGMVVAGLVDALTCIGSWLACQVICGVRIEACHSAHDSSQESSLQVKQKVGTSPPEASVCSPSAYLARTKRYLWLTHDCSCSYLGTPCQCGN